MGPIAGWSMANYGANAQAPGRASESAFMWRPIPCLASAWLPGFQFCGGTNNEYSLWITLGVNIFGISWDIMLGEILHYI